MTDTRRLSIERDKYRADAHRLNRERDELYERNKRLIQDIRDMIDSPQTIFIRCSGCDRLYSKGYNCPDGTKEGCVGW